MRKQKVNFNLSELDLKPLPFSENIEKKLLAYVCNKPDCISEAMKYLSFEGIFYNEWHKMIWMAMVEYSNKGTLINPENISDYFRIKGEKDISGYVKTFAILNEWWMSDVNFQNYCLKLNEYCISRILHRLGYYINQESIIQGKDALDLLGECSDGLDKVYRHIASIRETTMEDAVSDVYKTIFTATDSENGLLGLPSSINGINDRIKGYRNGNLIIIGASTGEGKTTLAWQDAVHIAETGNTVGYVSLEMSMAELAVISASDKLNIKSSDILSGTFTPEDQTRISNHMTRLKNLPLRMSDKSGLKIGEIKALARLWKKNHDLKILFIDHIHLAYDDIEHSHNVEQRFTNIANKLKELAKELNIPVVALAQLARREKSDRSRPHVISDIKYAGGIEQAADVVLLIYRPILHGIERDKDGNEIEKDKTIIIVGKLRLMSKKDILCRFNGTSFSDVTTSFLPVPFDNPHAGIRKPYTDREDNGREDLPF